MNFVPNFNGELSQDRLEDSPRHMKLTVELVTGVRPLVECLWVIEKTPPLTLRRVMLPPLG